MASKASATAITRAPSGISSPAVAHGIAVAVPALVVGMDDGEDVLPERDRLQDLDAQRGVLLHARRSPSRRSAPVDWSTAGSTMILPMSWRRAPKWMLRRSVVAQAQPPRDHVGEGGHARANARVEDVHALQDGDEDVGRRG